MRPGGEMRDAPALPAHTAIPAWVRLGLSDLTTGEKTALRGLAQGPAVPWRGTMQFRVRGTNVILDRVVVARTIGMQLATPETGPNGSVQINLTKAGRTLARELARHTAGKRARPLSGQEVRDRLDRLRLRAAHPLEPVTRPEQPRSGIADVCSRRHPDAQGRGA